jgi:Fic family protein
MSNYLGSAFINFHLKLKVNLTQESYWDPDDSKSDVPTVANSSTRQLPAFQSRRSPNRVYNRSSSPPNRQQDDLRWHLDFHIRQEPLNLMLVALTFARVSHSSWQQYLACDVRNDATPSKRILGFLYEFLTEKRIVLSKSATRHIRTMEPILILDPRLYMTGTVETDTTTKKWSVMNNLLGNRYFCPILRLNNQQTLNETKKLKQHINVIYKQTSNAIWKRTTSYLSKKETHSSWDIESAELSEEREDKFIALLRNAGKTSEEEWFTEEWFISKQHIIVDQEVQAKTYRKFPIAVCDTHEAKQHRFLQTSQKIHYAGVPFHELNNYMDAIRIVATKTNDLDPIARATVLSFAFVYAHPFEDGNGRLHRFILHDCLVREQFLAHGLTLPLSTYIQLHPIEYDNVLESISVPLMHNLRYDQTKDVEIQPLNKAECLPYWRYPDLTLHAEFIKSIVSDIIQVELKEEIDYLEKYDNLMEILQKYDIRTKAQKQMIVTTMMTNQGRLSNNVVKKLKKELTAEVLEEIQAEGMDLFAD